MVVDFGRDVFIPLGQAGADAFDDTTRWVDPNNRRFSDRLWLAKQTDRAAIDSILREGVARGRDPIQVARDLEDYLTPENQLIRNPETGRLSRKAKRDAAGNVMRDAEGRVILDQPKGVLTRTPRGGAGNYAARRLARTEVTRAFGKATIQAAELNPFVEGLKWNLSGAHSKPDECDSKARRSSRGMEPGVYTVRDVPSYPTHPNCRCYLSPVTVKDTDAVIAALKRDIDAGDFPAETTTAPTPLGRLAPSSIKNADTARAYFSGIGVQVDEVAGSARLFRLVAEAYEREIAAGATVPSRLSFVGKGGKRDVAAYTRRTDARTGALYDERINIYTRNRFWKDPEAVGKQLVADDYLVSPTPHGLITHEFGHWRHAQAIEKDLYGQDWRVKKTGERFSSSWRYDAPEKEIAQRVSRYAATKPEELVAEVYSGLRTGKTFDDEVMALYRGLGGPDA